MSEILNIISLDKSFGQKKVLENFNMTLQEGKVYGLLGNNGEGKTTLIRMIMGIIPSNKGEIFYKNQKIEFKHSAYKKEIGYIPEESFFYSWMTIKDLLDLNSSFYPKWNSKKAHEFLERFSLDNKVRIRTLSRGMKLKLGLIVALASEPELLILDDPTSGIDVPTRQDFLKGIIRELSEAGTTILFSTHLIHELEKIVDHLSILHNRHLILDEDYQKVKNAAKRVRITFKDSFPENIGIDGVLKEQREGNIADLVIYPWDKVMEKQIEALSPIRWDIEPLSLEEIFISFVSKNEK
ncbi:MAG: ABC transporter ATP-binding protein [Candidatus Aminicenantaceae bacterium]